MMFVILLALFNSIYNSVLVLTAVVLSITGVLIGMLVMGQTFSIIMTGTGIVALAGIVVNNNIVLIDTYQDFARRMPPLEAIVPRPGPAHPRLLTPLIAEAVEVLGPGAEIALRSDGGQPREHVRGEFQPVRHLHRCPVSHGAPPGPEEVCHRVFRRVGGPVPALAM
jgi:hypothetical protein